MKFKSSRFLIFAALLLAAFGAQAYSCTISSPGFVSVYDGLAATDNLNQSTYTLNCTRTSGESSTLNYQTNTDDGLYNNGQNNRAKLTTAASYIKYDFFTSSSYATNWSKGNKCIVGQLNFGGSLSASQTITYYSKLAAAQTGIPQGSYLDTVTINLAYIGTQTSCQNNATVSASGSFSVQVSNVPACQIAIPPPTVAFSYTAFQVAAATASSTFSARCSTTLAYTMALDSTVGVAGGLRYTLALSAASGSGNGALQNYNINGTMAAGQAGTCSTTSCTATDSRTLTITY